MCRGVGDSAGVGAPVVRRRDERRRRRGLRSPAPTIVDSGIPGVWVAIALVPTWLALAGGLLAIRREWDGLFVFSLTAPYVVALLGVFAILAID